MSIPYATPNRVKIRLVAPADLLANIGRLGIFRGAQPFWCVFNFNRTE